MKLKQKSSVRNSFFLLMCTFSIQKEMWIIHALPTFLSCHYVEMWSLQTMFLLVFLQIFFIFLKVFIVGFDAIFVNGLQETL